MNYFVSYNYGFQWNKIGWYGIEKQNKCHTERTIALLHKIMLDVHNFLSLCNKLYIDAYWIETLACLDISSAAPSCSRHVIVAQGYR